MGNQNLLYEIEWLRITTPNFDNKFNGFKAKFKEDELRNLSEEDKARFAIKQFKESIKLKSSSENQTFAVEKFSIDRLKNADLILESYSPLSEAIRETLNGLASIYPLADPNSSQRGTSANFLRKLIELYQNPTHYSGWVDRDFKEILDLQQESYEFSLDYFLDPTEKSNKFRNYSPKPCAIT